MPEAEPLLQLPPNKINSYGLFPVYLPTAREADILRIADDEGLPCPQCAFDLYAEKQVNWAYAGVILECVDGCGFREA